MKTLNCLSIGIIGLLVSSAGWAETGSQKIAAVSAEIVAGDYEQAGIDLAGLSREIESKIGTISADQRKDLFRHAMGRPKNVSQQAALDDLNACAASYTQGNWMAALGSATDASFDVIALMRQAGTGAVYQLDKARADTPRAGFADLLRAARAASNDKRPTEALEYLTRAIAAIEELPERGRPLLLRQAYTLQGLAFLDQNDQAAAEASLAASAIGQFGAIPPSMKLAKALLDRGDSAAVLKYLEQCKALWASGAQQLATWEAAIQAGQTPDFGPAAGIY
ncbi:MAG: hypothetical protein LAP38_19115 [Acidobacteriia bacterium]|nr:hypothetical protein [Terriglobia bacterium]